MWHYFNRAGDPGSIPGPGENFSLKLLIYGLSEGYFKAKISSKLGISVLKQIIRD